MNASAPTLNGPAIDKLESLDKELREWALGTGSDERRFPTLVEAGTLWRAGYYDGFPHLLLGAVAARDPEKEWSDDNTAMQPWCLSPAVCYHAFQEFAGRRIESGTAITARGTCFRREEAGELAPGRRQVEFQMREVVLLGTAEWIEHRIESLQPAIGSMAAARGLEGAWCPASDPFFLPRARGKAHMQRILGAKLELCLPCGLAIASINRHGTHLTERFDIRFGDDSPAHSACLAFGIDRWVAHIL